MLPELERGSFLSVSGFLWRVIFKVSFAQSISSPVPRDGCFHVSFQLNKRFVFAHASALARFTCELRALRRASDRNDDFEGTVSCKVG